MAQLLGTGLWTGARIGAGAGFGVTAGWGSITRSNMGGADGTGVSGPLDWQQIFQMQSPTAKVRRAAAIMAAGDVKAHCASGFCIYICPVESLHLIPLCTLFGVLGLLGGTGQ